MTNQEYIEAFKKYLIRKRKSENTIKNYISSMNIFSKWLKKSLVDATEDDIDEWINEKIEEEKRATSINRSLNTYRTFYRFLLRDGYIKKDPMLYIELVVDEEEKQCKYFTRKETNRILKNIKKHINYIESSTNTEDKLQLKYVIRNLAFINFAISTGCRVSEIYNLTMENLDMDKLEAKIVNTKGKKNRTVGMSNECAESMKAYLGIRDKFPNGEYVFLSKDGGNLDCQTANKILSGYNDIEGKRDYTFHSLRHSYATILYNDGVPIEQISKALGHASLDMTLQIYVHFENHTKLVV